MNPFEETQAYEELISSYLMPLFQETSTNGFKSVIIDFMDIAMHNSELAEKLLDNPYISLECLKKAIYNQGFGLFPRIINIPNSEKIKIKDFRAEHLSKLKLVTGIIRRTNIIKPECTSAVFECPTCGTLINIKMLNKFREPTQCSCGRKGHFKLLSKELRDFQNITIEEDPDEIESYEQPAKLVLELTDDLCSNILDRSKMVGTKVNVVGILHEIPIEHNGQLTNKFITFFEVNSIIPVDVLISDKITDTDKEMIKELSKREDIHKLLVNSFGTKVLGYEQVKLALILQMIGGSKVANKRDNIHLLVIGDPSVAKTALGLAVKEIMPKSRYISGKNATGVGITASVRKDEDGNWALDAGAMILANGSIAILDELDKFDKEDASYLNEAMETQTVSISKAGIQATLSCRTSLLALANPVGSRFDTSSDIPTQINVEPTIISRCDLILPMFANYNPQVTSFILDGYSNSNDEIEKLDYSILKKYIIYAKNHKLSGMNAKAKAYIKDYYDSEAKKGFKGVVRIEPRQLESLIRLSHASAKLRLAEEVTELDAEVAVSLMKYMLYMLGMETTSGNVDIDKVFQKTSNSKRNKNMYLVNTLRTAFKTEEIGFFELFNMVKDKGFTEDEFRIAIDKLKEEGFIWEPKNNMFKPL